MTSFFSEGGCGYYPDRITRNHGFTDEKHAFTREQITRVLSKGYRRFGYDYYRPYCRGCRECTPYRVLVDQFTPNRSFRRTLKRNADLRVLWDKPQPTQQKFEMYVRYQLTRHKEMDESPELRRELAMAMVSQMYMNPADTLELTIFKHNTILGYAIFDRTLDSLSAVYSVFEPDEPARSLGTFNILLAIEKTRELGLPYLNLGLYLASHEKMAYKKNFGPAEVYTGFSWKLLS